MCVCVCVCMCVCSWMYVCVCVCTVIRVYMVLKNHYGNYLTYMYVTVCVYVCPDMHVSLYL